MCALGGKLYTLGGYEQSFVSIAACRTWDPTANAWSSIADLPRPRGACVAVELGGRIYVVGGVVPGVGVVGDLTSWDPASNRWTTLPSMPTPREHLAAAALGGKLYVAGGRVGSTLHLVDSGVDTGAVLRRCPYTWNGDESMDLVGWRLWERCLDLLVEACREPWPAARSRAVPQGAGQQYYLMPPRLWPTAEQRLRRFLRARAS